MIAPPPARARGALANLVVFRFAHAYESGGGTERYLDDLDRVLLERNAMTIVRMHLTRSPERAAPGPEAIGLGQLVRLPVPARRGRDVPQEPNGALAQAWARTFFRTAVAQNPVLWRLFTARWAARRKLQPQPGQAIGAGEAARRLFQQQRPSLAVMHYFGGADADEVILAARDAGVPIGLLNHYSNDRYLHLAIRKHVMLAQGIAGVNGLQVPRYLRGNFSNLSDGIDTDFFRRERASAPSGVPALPTILLPARVTREKGHLDLVHAAARLRDQGVACAIAFAGRTDSHEFVAELNAEIRRLKLEQHVLFIGDLAVDRLRDWYAASAAVAFPTYHHEGLGRAIVEALAVETPVVAYATGGVPEAILQGETGYLISTGDIEGLARHLAILVTDETRRRAMGRAGRADMERRFSLCALAERHEEFYLRVARARSIDRAA